METYIISIDARTNVDLKPNIINLLNAIKERWRWEIFANWWIKINKQIFYDEYLIHLKSLSEREAWIALKHNQIKLNANRKCLWITYSFIVTQTKMLETYSRAQIRWEKYLREKFLFVNLSS